MNETKTREENSAQAGACGFTGCVGMAESQHGYCSVHDPRAVLARARRIVITSFDHYMTGRRRVTKLTKLRDVLLKRLDDTL